jgi:preprotein translocase subunit SecF
MHIFKNTTFDFLRWRVHALMLSWIIILAGVATIWTQGIRKGVEFAGGTVVIEQFDQTVSVEQVRTELDRHYPGGGRDAVVQSYGDPSQRMMMIRVPHVGAEAGTSLSVTAQQVEDALKQGSLGTFHRQGAEIVSATVGRELTSKGLWAMGLSLIGILLYLAFRFQFSFGVGAVIATIHDLLITMAFLAFFRYDMTLNVIAALLTMTGYSTNDTIVIFDRVRENMRSMRRDSLKHIINASVNQTLGRTVITSGTASRSRWSSASSPAPIRACSSPRPSSASGAAAARPAPPRTRRLRPRRPYASSRSARRRSPRRRQGLPEAQKVRSTKYEVRSVKVNA